MTKNEKRSLVAIVMLTPFAVSAALEFLPAWIAVPFTVVSAIMWFGSMLMIKDDKEEKTEKCK